MTLSLEIAGVGFAAKLARHGGRPAILTGATAVTYSELAGHVQDFSSRLGSARRLVLLVADNSLDSLVAYLAALSSGHPLLLAPADNPGTLASLMAAYDPDVIVRPGTGGPGSAAGHASARSRLPVHRAAAGGDPGRDCPRSPPRSGAAAQHLRLHRLAQAGAALPRATCSPTRESIADYLGIRATTAP